MLIAFAWGLVSTSSLVVGALIALRWRISHRRLGLIMAFGAGVLIGAVAYELVQEAFELAGGAGIASGLIAGGLTFTFGNALLQRPQTAHAAGADATTEASHASGAGAPTLPSGRSTAVAIAVVFGAVLDGIPESTVLGLTLLDGQGVSIAMLAAVFVSNLPEAAAATSGLIEGGWSPFRVLRMWTVVALACSVAAALGYGVLGEASDGVVAFVQAFAAGAILTMLADTMMPEAYRDGGTYTGITTTLGFGLAFVLAELE